DDRRPSVLFPLGGRRGEEGPAMYDRTIDRMSDGASEFLVQFYLHSPKLSITVLLAAWLILFFFALWYFVLLPATANNLVNGSFEARLVGWGTGWLEDFP